MHGALQLTQEKEKSAARLREEMQRAERLQHEALADAVKAQAELKKEMADVLQRVKVLLMLFLRITTAPVIASSLFQCVGTCMVHIALRVVHSFIQSEETKRIAEQDMKLNKYREGLLTSHAMEIEKMHDRHRADKKRYQVMSLTLRLTATAVGLVVLAAVSV